MSLNGLSQFTLSSHQRNAHALRFLVFFLTASIVFVSLFFLPVLGFNIKVASSYFSFQTILDTSSGQLDAWFPLLLFLFILVVPIFYFFCSMMMSIILFFNIQTLWAYLVYKYFCALREFYFFDIFLVSFLLAFSKIYGLGDIVLESGFFLLSGLMLFEILMNAYLTNSYFFECMNVCFKKYDDFFRNFLLIKMRRQYIYCCLAIYFTGFIFFIGCHFFPALETNQIITGSSSNTIISGILYFLKNGDYVLGIIVFLASIVFPIIKFIIVILVLKWHLNGVKLSIKMNNWYLSILHFGRWSMLDFFVVAVVVMLVQFGNLESYTPGLGILFFTFSVFCTMLSSKLIHKILPH